MQKGGEGGCFRIEGLWLRLYTLDMAKEKKQKKQGRINSRQVKEIQAAIDYGIDVSMLMQNINRSYTERIVRHQIALNTVEKLRKARGL